MHYKAKRGLFSFSGMTRPDKHAEYNRWHLFDHVPEYQALEHIMLGQRWVCPPQYQRLSQCDATLEGHQYMTLYLMQDPADAALREFLELGPRLDALGLHYRQHRKSYMGGVYQIVKAYSAARAKVSPAALPFRPNIGLYVTIDDLVDKDAQYRAAHWLDEVHLPRMLESKHVAGAYWFRALPHERAGSGPTGAPSPEGRRVIVHYLDGDTTEALGELRERQLEKPQDDPGGFRPVMKCLYHSIPPDSKFDWFE